MCEEGREEAAGLGQRLQIAEWGLAIADLRVVPRARRRGGDLGAYRRTAVPAHHFAPWHFLYFFPLPQGQGSLRPTLGIERCCVAGALSVEDSP